MTNALSFAGLVVDIAGVVLLGWALIIPRWRMLYEQAATDILGNRALFRALRAQRFDAWLGVGSLLVGFIAQAAAAWGVTIPWRGPISRSLSGCPRYWWSGRCGAGGTSPDPDQVFHDLGQGASD